MNLEKWNIEMLPIKFDRTINLGHMASIIIFLVGGLGAYYDVKSDVRLHANQIVAIQNALVEERAAQSKHDEQQDKATAAAIVDLKGILSDNKRDIKDDIRDLRNDIARGPNRGTTR